VGIATIFASRLSASSTAVTLGSEISTRGFVSATLGFGSATLGKGVAQHASGWDLNWFCYFAFASEAFANSIFVNGLLTLRRASAALVSGATFPCRVLVSCRAAWMTIVLGDTLALGFVTYWCLKNTVLFILVTLVLTI
jgi:hypothetical protein